MIREDEQIISTIRLQLAGDIRKTNILSDPFELPSLEEIQEMAYQYNNLPVQ
jgi:hypothetical protein